MIQDLFTSAMEVSQVPPFACRYVGLLVFILLFLRSGCSILTTGDPSVTLTGLMTSWRMRCAVGMYEESKECKTYVYSGRNL